MESYKEMVYGIEAKAIRSYTREALKIIAALADKYQNRIQISHGRLSDMLGCCINTAASIIRRLTKMGILCIKETYDRFKSIATTYFLDKNMIKIHILKTSEKSVTNDPPPPPKIGGPLPQKLGTFLKTPLETSIHVTCTKDEIDETEIERPAQQKESAVYKSYKKSNYNYIRVNSNEYATFVPQLKKWGCTDSQIAFWIRTHSVDHICYAMSDMKQLITDGTEIKNPGAYLKSSLKRLYPSCYGMTQVNVDIASEEIQEPLNAVIEQKPQGIMSAIKGIATGMLANFGKSEVFNEKIQYFEDEKLDVYSKSHQKVEDIDQDKLTIAELNSKAAYERFCKEMGM